MCPRYSVKEAHAAFTYAFLSIYTHFFGEEGGVKKQLGHEQYLLIFLGEFMKKTHLLLGTLLASSVIFAGCSTKTAESTNTDSTVMASPISDENAVANESLAAESMDASDGALLQNESGVMVGGALMVANKNIVENAMNANNVTTLIVALKAAGLVETLSGKGPFTVFAPTDAAFKEVPSATLQSLMKPENKKQLTSLLTYHVVPGRYTAADLKDGMKLKTVQGEELTVVNTNGKISIKDAKGGTAVVETKDVISSNGVTFVVDAVLMPKTL